MRSLNSTNSIQCLTKKFCNVAHTLKLPFDMSPRNGCRRRRTIDGYYVSKDHRPGSTPLDVDPMNADSSGNSAVVFMGHNSECDESVRTNGH